MADINKLIVDNYKVYADIDMLVDTKFSILKAYLPDVAFYSLVEDQYVKRTSDTFKTPDFKCNYNLFKVLYMKRDPLILFNSSLTSVPFIIEKDFQTFLNNSLSDSDKTISLLINIYPYKLLEEEVNFFGEILKETLDDRINLEFFYCDPRRIPASFIVENDIKVIYMEEGLKWLNRIINTKEFFEHPLVDIHLRVPELFNWFTPRERDITKDMEHFYAVVKAIIQLEFISPMLLTSLSILERNIESI